MNSIQLKQLALISACNARIEGMKAENQHRINCGHDIAYDEEAFNKVSKELKDLAKEAIEL